jgi:hypothetical protein
LETLDQELEALDDLAREYVRTQRYPLAPRLAPIKAALAKLDLAGKPPPPGSKRKRRALPQGRARGCLMA